MRNALFQIHWFLGITAGLVLAVVGVTGGLMSFERQIMEAISPEIVRVEVRGDRLEPNQILAHLNAQRPNDRVEQLTFWPDAERSALVRFAPPEGQRRGDTVYVNPYNGEQLGKIRGEQFFRTLRSLHRWLLIPSQEGAINIGRQITGFCALALVFFSLSGLYLRWPRRPLNWRNWFRIDFSLKGRNFYWALHSVIGTWVIVLYLLMALTGLTWSYSWFKNGASLVLTGEALQERGMEGRGARGSNESASLQPLTVSTNAAWQTFANDRKNQFRFASINIPKSAKDPVVINYVASSATNDRQRSTMTINADSGNIINHQPYTPAEPLGKRIFQGIYELHTGEWFGTPGVIVNMIASLLMPLFTITGLLLYIDRRKKKHVSRQAASVFENKVSQHTDADYWIVYASQTGTAEQLAWNTATILQSGGIKASVKNISALDRTTLESAQKMLFLLSTFGEGECPDSARSFVKKFFKATLPLNNLHFAILGLGDKRYSDFCAFAGQVENWLRANGARPLFDRINVDNGDETKIHAWQSEIAAISGVENISAWAAPEYEEWHLQKRELLNAGSLGNPIYRVSLQPGVPGNTHWQAGDILEIKPHNNLEFPHREYSIASVVTDAQLDLVVRQMANENGELGLGSGWLTTLAPEGGKVLARVRSNPSFHAPDEDLPMILIGAGTGIAGLRAHLRERYLKDIQQNWLIFGERQRATDRLFSSELESWQASGFLTQLDEIYSRDGEGYVQNCVAAKCDQVREWLANGAAIYVCGSLAMGKGVHEELIRILGAGTVQQLIDQQRYRRDIY